MTRTSLLLCLVLLGCNKEPTPTVEVGYVGVTFCQDGALYQVPTWDETGKFGFIIEGKTC